MEKISIIIPCYNAERCLAYMRCYVYIPHTYYFYYLNPEGTWHNKRAFLYFMDAVTVQNQATDRIIEENLQAGCEQEWEYIHFYKAFRDPMIKMISNRTFFSYEYCLILFAELQKRYPNAAENIYLDKVSTDASWLFMCEVAGKLYGKQELVTLMYGKDGGMTT